MSKKKTLDIGKIAYLSMRDLAYSYSGIYYGLVGEDQEIDYDLDIQKNIGIESSLVVLALSINLKLNELSQSPEEMATASYSTEHYFKIDDIEQFVTIRNNIFELENSLENALTEMAYSTFRGLLYQKFTGTLFSDFILPPRIFR